MGHRCPRDYGELIWEASQKAAEFVRAGMQSRAAELGCGWAGEAEQGCRELWGSQSPAAEQGCESGVGSGCRGGKAEPGCKVRMGWGRVRAGVQSGAAGRCGRLGGCRGARQSGAAGSGEEAEPGCRARLRNREEELKRQEGAEAELVRVTHLRQSSKPKSGLRLILCLQSLPLSFSFPLSFPIVPFSFLHPYWIHNYLLSLCQTLWWVLGHNTE